jgi:hypothetical protein
MEINWEKTNISSAVLSLRVHSSIVTTDGYSAECELNLSWLDVGSISITCPNKHTTNYEKGSPFPLEIPLSSVQAFNFPVSTMEGVLHLELNFTCGMLTNLLHGEQKHHDSVDRVHKLVTVLETDDKAREMKFQVREYLTTVPINTQMLHQDMSNLSFTK